MATVCIVGAGDLGSAVADALAGGDRVSRVLLVDAAAQVARGKALDILQACAVRGVHTRLDGTDDPSYATGCDVCVIADTAGAGGSEWQGEDGCALLRRLAGFVAGAPFVFAGATQSDLLAATAREAGVRRERLIGSAPEALAAAVTAMAAMEAGCSPAEVRLTVLGLPPAGFVIPWSEASIAGLALERVLTQVQLARLEARAARLWPPGPFTLGLAAARVTEAIVGSSRRTFSVSTLLGGEFGVRNRVAALPARLSPAGIAHTRVPALNPRERVQLETALARGLSAAGSR